jgi:RHS repeat-associated protein
VVPGWKYQYALKDHLGNGRVWFEPNTANTAAVVTQQAHYYAFGMEMEGLSTAAGPNKYHYNGKELNEDFGLNWSDYGARWYDAAVGRWWSVDALAEKYKRWSGYNYGVDNPIRFIDPDGRQIIIGYQDENGKKQKAMIRIL